MKKRFMEEQTINVLTRLKNGATAKELGREIGASEASIYAWR